MAAQPTTRWQVSGYRFLVRRMEHALVRRDVRMIHDPMRSQSRSFVVGVVVACVVLAGCAALALFRPQDRIGNSTLVVGRDSGALYVSIDGIFHPALNLASARLILGTPEEPAVVADEQLSERPRGPLVGIPGAPSSLAYLEDDVPWTVCDTVDAADRRSVTTAVFAGPPRFDDSDGALDDDEAFLVNHDGTYHLVYEGTRAEIPVENTALTRVLGIDPRSARPIGPGMFAALREVPALAPPVIPGAGEEPDIAVGAYRIGAVLALSEPGGRRFYVVLRDGIQEISQATALILHHSDSQGVAEIPTVPPDLLGRAPTVRHLAVDTFPSVVPTVVDVAEHPVGCLTWEPVDGADDRNRSRLVVSAARGIPLPEDATPVIPAGADGPGPGIDAVHVPPGRGAYVQTTSIADDSERRGALFFVADTGVRYGIEDKDSAAALGFPAEPMRAPWQIVELLASGPTLGRGEALLAHDGLDPDPRPAPVRAGG